MPVYYGGAAHNREKIFEFSNYHNLHLIEDAAHAFTEEIMIMGY